MRTLLTLSLLLACTLPVQAEILAREGQGYLEKRADGQLVLHLKGSPYEMGFQHGKLAKHLAKDNLQKIVNNQGEMGKSPQYTAYLLMRGDMHKRLRAHIPQRFKDELRGLAEGSGMKYADVEAGNLFPAAFHCSGIALKGKATHDGSLYHVRILDYMTKLGLQDSSLIIIHEPTGKRKWMNVGFAGFIGSVTGMNASHIAIGEMGGKGLGYWDGMPMAFLIRDALERADTLEQAVEIFKTTPRTCEYYYVISDGKTNDAIGLWTTPKVFETMRLGESFGMIEKLRPRGPAAGRKAIVRNPKVDTRKHSVLLRGEKGVEGFFAMPPEDTLVLSGPDRYRTFIERLLPNYGKVDEKQLIEMVKRPVSMKSNLHVAIFHPSTLEAWVAVAASDGTPACNQPYYRFQLTKTDSKASK